MLKIKRVATITVVIGLLGGQTLWAGWMVTSGLLERDARRLETARKNHVTDVERAFNVYTTQVERANVTLTRNYEQVIRQYESRGARDTVEALKKELEELTAGAIKMPFPEEEKEEEEKDEEKDKEKKPEPPAKPPHEQLIRWIGPDVVNAYGDRAKTAGLAEYDYVLLYYTAGWCMPCRMFTPQLVNFYQDNRRLGKWEAITVSGDHNEMAMQDYLRGANIPWGAVPFDRLEPSGLLTYQPTADKDRRFSGWPRMVVLDRDGKAVLHAVGGSQTMLNQFRELLRKSQN